MLASGCAAVSAAGCGGGSSGTQTTTTQAAGSTAAATTAGAPSATSAPAGSSGTSTGAPPSASAGDALAAANAICTQRGRELAAISNAGARSSLHALAAAERRRAAIQRRALSELEKLTPPANVAAVYRKLIAAGQANLLQIVKLGERAQAGDAAGAQAAKAKAGARSLRTLVAVARTGLKRCVAIG